MRFDKIHYKITFIFTIIIALILLGIYMYLNNSLKNHTYQRIRSNLAKQTVLIRSFLEERFSPEFRYENMDAIADDIGEDLGLRVTIISLKGTVYGDTELDDEALTEVENHLYRPEVQDAVHDGIGESRRFSTTVRKEMLYLAMPFGKEAIKGIIRLSIPLSEIEAISDKLKKLLIASFLIAFVFAVIVSYLVSMFISGPIREISNVARSVAGGNFSSRITVVSRDEIGDLAEAFNYMSEQVRLKMQEITLSRSRLEAVLLSMFEGVMVVDAGGTIMLMNKALKDILAVREEPAGRRPLEIVRNIEIQELADRALGRKYGVETCEVSILGPDEKILSVHATPVIREGKIEGAVLIFYDITELRRLEKIRRDFVANVSHELRTPVSSIKGYAETLLDGALRDKENAKEFLKIIYSDSDRLSKLIDDLLDLSKIESGKFKMSLKPCAVGPIVKRVVAGLDKQAKEKSVKIEMGIPKNIPDVLADEARMAQVLLNLVDNAIKYNRQTGNVIIEAMGKGEFVEINISDTGFGISEADLPRLFERFYRVDKARSRELGGTGLGLSIVKHIIQAHKGEVSVRSVEGQGSTFSFTIPRA